MADLWYTVPLALTLAVSVFPIAAVLLLLLAPDPLTRSVPFAVGSIIGIAALVAIFAIGASLLPDTSKNHYPSWVHGVEIAVGVCLIIAAVFLALRKPGPPPSGEDSKLSAATSRLTPWRAFGFGLVMNIRPKSIVLTVAAGLAIGTAPVAPIVGGVTVILFAIVAGSIIAGLVITYAIGQNRVRPALESLRNYLTTHAGLVLMAALGAIGIVLVLVGVTQLVTGS